MSERIFVCQLTLLNIDTYSNVLIESSINTNEMYSRVNEKLIYIYSFIYFIFHNKDYTKMWRGDLKKPQGFYEEAPSLQ